VRRYLNNILSITAHYPSPMHINVS